MANKVYPKFKRALLGGSRVSGEDLNLLVDNVKVALIDTGIYAYSDAHEFLSDIPGGSTPGGAVVAASSNLSGKTISATASFDANDPVFSSVSGAVVSAIVLYVDTGFGATSRLIFYQDTGVTGLPITPNGGNITITFDAAGVFQL